MMCSVVLAVDISQFACTYLNSGRRCPSCGHKAEADAVQIVTLSVKMGSVYDQAVDDIASCMCGAFDQFALLFAAFLPSPRTQRLKYHETGYDG